MSDFFFTRLMESTRDCDMEMEIKIDIVVSSPRFTSLKARNITFGWVRNREARD